MQKIWKLLILVSKEESATSNTKVAHFTHGLTKIKGTTDVLYRHDLGTRGMLSDMRWETGLSKRLLSGRQGDFYGRSGHLFNLIMFRLRENSRLCSGVHTSLADDKHLGFCGNKEKKKKETVLRVHPQEAGAL